MSGRGKRTEVLKEASIVRSSVRRQKMGGNGYPWSGARIAAEFERRIGRVVRAERDLGILGKDGGLQAFFPRRGICFDRE